MKIIKSDKFKESLNHVIPHINQLWVEGEIGTEPMIAIVGSRKYSEYGRKITEKIISELEGVTIVSGMAIGIDSIAHRAAINNGLKTVAVLGSGLDESVIYPKINIQLSKDIVASGGALVSEMKPKERPTKYSFVKRNRIIAGLADVVLVIECEKVSGTRTTVRFALDYGKTVCAVPHNVDGLNSEGVNEIISEGAYPISSGKELMGFPAISDSNLTINEKKILRVLPCSKDDVCLKTGLSIDKVEIAIELLRNRGMLKEEFGNVVGV